MSSISKKIAWAIIGSCIVLSILLTSISAIQSTLYLSKETEAKLLSESEKYAQRFGIALGRVENTVDVSYANLVSKFDFVAYKSNPRDYLMLFLSEIDKRLLAAAQIEEHVQGIYFTLNPEILNEWHEIWYADVQNNGNYEKLFMDPATLELFYDGNPDFAYYFDTLRAEGPIWIDPYTDNTIDVYMVSYVRPIKINGELIAIIGADLQIDRIVSTIKDMQINETGFSMLVNKHNDVIVHPHHSTITPLSFLEDGAYAEIEKTIRTKPQGIETLKIGNKPHHFAYFTLANDWIFAVQTPTQEALASALSLIRNLALAGLAGSITAAIIGIFIARRLDALIDSYNHSAVEAQQLLMESEKFSSLIHLVSGIAHELNTPIGNAITLSSFMSSEITKAQAQEQVQAPESLSPLLSEIQEASNHIERNLNKAQDLIASFKSLARHELPLHFEPIQVRDQLELIYASLTASLEDKTITFDLQCDDELVFLGHLLHFTDIFHHLIHNSIVHGFFNQSSGTIALRVRPTQLQDGRKGLAIRYLDNGCGIRPENLQNLYVPFYSTRFSSDHKGLGMPIVRTLIQSTFDGELTVKSVVGQGIEVDIFLSNPPN